MLRFFLVFFSFISIYGCSSVSKEPILPISKITESRSDGNYYMQTAFYSISLKDTENVNKVEKLIKDAKDIDKVDPLTEYKHFFTTFNNYSDFHSSLINKFSVVSFYNTARDNNKIHNSIYNSNKYLSSVVYLNGETTKEYSDYETGINYSFTINNNDDKSNASLTTDVVITDIDENFEPFVLNKESISYPSTIEKEISHTFSINDFKNNTIYYDYLKDKDNIYIVFYYITN